MPDVTLPVSYTSVTRVQSAFPAVGSVSAINSAIIHQFAGDAESEINAKIGKRYQLPLTVVCPLLTTIATRETIYGLTVDRLLAQFPPAQQGKLPRQVRHEQDQKMLDDIMNGKIGLVDSSGQAITANTDQIEVISNTMNYVPTMDEGPVLEWETDPYKLADIAAAKD